MAATASAARAASQPAWAVAAAYHASTCSLEPFTLGGAAAASDVTAAVTTLQALVDALAGQSQDELGAAAACVHMASDAWCQQLRAIAKAHATSATGPTLPASIRPSALAALKAHRRLLASSSLTSKVAYGAC